MSKSKKQSEALAGASHSRQSVNLVITTIEEKSSSTLLINKAYNQVHQKKFIKEMYEFIRC